MKEDEATWRGSQRGVTPAASGGVTLTGIDVPFVQLTFFFIKASLSMALALTLTSGIWVAVGALLTAITVGGWLALTAVFGPYGDPVAPGTASTPVVVLPPEPPPPPPELPPAPEVVITEDPIAAREPSPSAAGTSNRTSVEQSDAATEAALRAELEALRQRRGR